MTTQESVTPVSVKNVLFATDFSPCSRTALPYALSLARRYGANLYAAHVLSPETYLFGTPDAWPELREPLAQMYEMNEEKFEARLRELSHPVVEPGGGITDVLFRLVRDYQIDLLVLGTHGRTGLAKMVLGSVAEDIFRQSPIPVLTIGPNVTQREGRTSEFDRVLLAVDVSDGSHAAVRYAVSLARDQHVHLDVLHVLSEPETGSVDLESNSSFLLRRLEALVPPDPTLWHQPDYAVEFGDVPEQILKFADARGSDLIVLGVHSSQGSLLTAKHFESVAQRIAAQAACPVLTVRE
jgi:nucleotide-binding universal stress UspA family protein